MKRHKRSVIFVSRYSSPKYNSSSKLSPKCLNRLLNNFLKFGHIMIVSNVAS